MQVEEFLDVINECDFLREDIEEIRERQPLSKGEGDRLAQAVGHVEKARLILTALFPTIKSLDEDARDQLAEELETD